jgi:hypothetical protein
MVLRDSEHCGATDLAAVLRWARSSVGADLEGYRSEFVRMVEEARRIAVDPPRTDPVDQPLEGRDSDGRPAVTSAGV